MRKEGVMFECICTCTSVCIMYTHVPVSVYVYTHVPVCVYVYTHVHVCVYMYTCTCVFPPTASCSTVRLNAPAVGILLKKAPPKFIKPYANSSCKK